MNLKNIIKSPRTKYIFNFLSDLIIVLLIALLIRTQVGSFFRVSGQSMIHTLEDRDLLLVNKIGYRFNDIERGDVVIVVPPSNPDIFYVKRVIGMPGEQIRFQDGDVEIKNAISWQKIDESKYLTESNNHHSCPQPYAGAGICGANMIKTTEIINIPDGYYYLLGDNRRHSTDSRSWNGELDTINGAINENHVVGRAILRLYLNDSLMPQAKSISKINYTEIQK